MFFQSSFQLAASTLSNARLPLFTNIRMSRRLQRCAISIPGNKFPTLAPMSGNSRLLQQFPTLSTALPSGLFAVTPTHTVQICCIAMTIDFATTAAPQRRSENRCDVVACSSLTSTLAVGDGASLPDTDGVEAGIGNKAKNSHTVNSTGPTTKAPDIDSTNINSSSNSSNAVVVFGGNSRSEIDQTSVFGSKHGGYRSRLSISPLPHPQDIGRLSPVGSTSNPMDPNSSLAASESCRSSARAERGAGARAGGVEFVEGMSTGGFDNDARLLPGWDNHSEEEEEGSVVAEWWRDALTPSSRRPITRRSLVGGTAENSGCIWGLEGRKGSEGGVGYRTRDYGGRPATAPTCDFSTESKQRGLEGCLQRRCGTILIFAL